MVATLCNDCVPVALIALRLETSAEVKLAAKLEANGKSLEGTGVGEG